MKIQRNYIEKSVRNAIFEDLGKKDITSNLIFKKKTVTAKLVFGEKSILCGKPWIDCFYFFTSLKLNGTIRKVILLKKFYCCCNQGSSKRNIDGRTSDDKLSSNNVRDCHKN